MPEVAGGPFARAHTMHSFHHQRNFDPFGHTHNMTADEFFEFLFSGNPPEAQQTRRRERRHVDVDDEAEDIRDTREDDAQDSGLSLLFERIRPLLWMLLFLLMAMILSNSPENINFSGGFSLQRSRYYSVSRTTRNGVTFFTVRGSYNSPKEEEKLWYSVDRQALEQYRQVCASEIQKENDLRYQASAWLNGRNKRERFRRELDRFRKPSCDQYYQLQRSMKWNG